MFFREKKRTQNHSSSFLQHLNTTQSPGDFTAFMSGQLMNQKSTFRPPPPPSFLKSTLSSKSLLEYCPNSLLTACPCPQGGFSVAPFSDGPLPVVWNAMATFCKWAPDWGHLSKVIFRKWAPDRGRLSKVTCEAAPTSL